MDLRRSIPSAVLFFLTALAAPKSEAQSSVHGWLAFSHEQELSKKWKLLGDVQFRSAKNMEYLETILLRPGISYSFSETFSAALGYAYLGNWEKEGAEKSFDKEHRSWQQVQKESKAGRIELTNRLRLEQRFVEGSSSYDFSQRLRYYLRAQMPLRKSSEFTRGWFLGVQDEVFVNVQNKEKVNGRFFDQNRAFFSVGFRFLKAFDLEAGYLYRYQIEEEKMHHHIVQCQVTTSL